MDFSVCLEFLHTLPQNQHQSIMSTPYLILGKTKQCTAFTWENEITQDVC